MVQSRTEDQLQYSYLKQSLRTLHAVMENIGDINDKSQDLKMLTRYVKFICRWTQSKIWGLFEDLTQG